MIDRQQRLKQATAVNQSWSSIRGSSLVTGCHQEEIQDCAENVKRFVCLCVEHQLQ